MNGLTDEPGDGPTPGSEVLSGPRLPDQHFLSLVFPETLPELDAFTQLSLLTLYKWGYSIVSSLPLPP